MECAELASNIPFSLWLGSMDKDGDSGLRTQFFLRNQEAF